MRRLPGISIVDVPPPPDDGLPVMDVPVFVGFAERGPRDRPVGLEDPMQYAAVFGGTLDLVPVASDATGGASQSIEAPRMQHAHLPAAITSFFAGGGRRCYVVRVTGDGADSARFTVPGLKLATRDRDATGNTGPWRLTDRDFELRANSPGAWADRYELAVRLAGEILHADDRMQPGDVLRARRPGAGALVDIGWLRIDRAATVGEAIAGAAPGAWLWTTDGASPPDPPAIVTVDDWLIDRVTVDLALRHPERPELRRENCGLAAGAANLPWFEPDIDGRFDAGDDLIGLSWPLAGVPLTTAPFDPASPDWMLVPSAVGVFFDPWSSARLGEGDALARNGLDNYSSRLFLDPAWTEGLRGRQLLGWADDIRFLGDRPRRLRGLHAALGFDDAVVRDATWIAVPDAAHPGWELTKALIPADGRLTATPDPDCAGAVTTAMSPCVKPPRRPEPPVFTLPARVPADVDWFIDLIAPVASPPSPPDGDLATPLSFEAQWAQRPDFSDAQPLPVSTGVVDTRVFPPARYRLHLSAGLYFLRARVQRSGLVSNWSEVAEVLSIPQTRVLEAGPTDPAVVLPVHTALMDLCAATREHFALLSVPLDWDATAIGKHVQALRAHAARDIEASQATSFVALHHPWLLQREDDTSLQAHPPEGAVLGVYARRSRLKGAWSAAGLEPLAAGVGLATVIDPEAIETAGANAIELRPLGLAATRAATLSEEEDWQAVGVRRLFILLRRLARREGERYVFEPNDFTLRRSLERSFDALLQRLMQRGAFRGASASDSYALRTAAGAQALAEIERGECSLEIRVAPSRPLRFLTLRVVRAGEQLSIEER
ncbi:MAG: hypothetical protein U1F76_06870 [Candidatus Competibacteraceae bacterium]